MSYRTTPASNPFVEISGGDLVGYNLLNTSSGGWTFAMGLNRNGIGSWQCLCLLHDTSAEKLFLAEINPSNQVVVGDEFGSVNSTFTVTEQTADIIIAVSWDGTDNVAGNMRLSYFNGTSWTHNTVTWNSAQAAVAMQSTWRFKLMNNLSNGDDLNGDVIVGGLRLGGRSQAQIEALSVGSGGYATWQTMFDISDAWLHKFDNISSRTDDANGSANETSRSGAGLAFQTDPTGFYAGGGGTAPSNTVAPVASGTPTTGQNLSCTTGTWTGDPTITYGYQWQRNGTNISGATSSTYTLQEADEGNPIRCVVTATNGAGSASANSNAITVLDEPVNSVAPAISGTPETGVTVSCSTGTWSNTPTSYTYQWKRNGTNISGATSSTYLLDVADEGQSVKCTVTASNANGSGTPTDSNTITPSAPSGGGPEPTCFLKWGGELVPCVSRVKFGGALFPEL